MKIDFLKKACLTILLLCAGATLSAQKIVQIDSPNLARADQATSPERAESVIFSNLGPTATNKYDSRVLAALPVIGNNVYKLPETWGAVNFIPNRDVQARVLLAAINYVSGTKLVELALYSDAGGKVGSPLPGAQGSTTQIPPTGECCELTKVTLAGSGVTLTGGTRYWLVAKPDNVNGSDFNGTWQTSNAGTYAQFDAPGPWQNGIGGWLAAEVRGAPVAGSSQASKKNLPSPRTRRITIFNNLGSTPTERFYGGLGYGMGGKSAADGSEVWLALPFYPKVTCHAQTLAVAIGYVSGDMKVNLGIYSDNGGTVGSLLPGGEASTTNIPAYPTCCDLATVVLPGPGVALTAKTPYWLVASTDDIHAPSFEGYWREATAYSNYQEPEFFFWTFIASRWLAAEIQGTSP